MQHLIWLARETAELLSKICYIVWNDWLLPVIGDPVCRSGRAADGAGALAAAVRPALREGAACTRRLPARVPAPGDAAFPEAARRLCRHVQTHGFVDVHVLAPCACSSVVTWLTHGVQCGPPFLNREPRARAYPTLRSSCMRQYKSLCDGHALGASCSWNDAQYPNRRQACTTGGTALPARRTRAPATCCPRPSC